MAANAEVMRQSARLGAKRDAAAAAAQATAQDEPRTPQVKKRRGSDSERAAAEWVLELHVNRAAAAAAHGIPVGSASSLTYQKTKLEVAAKAANLPLKDYCSMLCDAAGQARGEQPANLAAAESDTRDEAMKKRAWDPL